MSEAAASAQEDVNNFPVNDNEELGAGLGEVGKRTTQSDALSPYKTTIEHGSTMNLKEPERKHGEEERRRVRKDFRIRYLNLKNSPFKHKHPKLRWYEYVKIILVCCTGIPLIRILLTVFAALTMAGLYAIISCCFTQREKSLVRFITTQGGTFGSRLCLFLWGFYYIPTRFRRGTNKCMGCIPCSGCCINTDAPLLVANHSSAVTDFVVLLAFHLPGFVAMEPVRHYPILGPLAEAIGCVFVDRRKKNKHTSMAAVIAKRANEYVPGISNPRLAVFCEGTVTQAQSLTKFRSGAFVAGAPVQPVCIRYSEYGSDLSTLSLAGGPSDLTIFLRMITNFINFVELEYLSVYEPSEAEKKDPSLYARNVRNEMAKVLGYPVSEHTYEDMFLQGKCGFDYYDKYALHKVSGLQLKAITGLSLRDLAKFVKAFKMLDEIESGYEMSRSMQDNNANSRPGMYDSNSKGGDSAGIDATGSPDNESMTKSTGKINRVSFHALALGIVNIHGQVVNQVYEVVSSTEKDTPNISELAGGADITNERIDIISAALGIAILKDVLPEDNKIRLAFHCNSEGLVSSRTIRSLIELHCNVTGVSSDTKSAVHKIPNIVQEGKVHIDDLVSAKAESPVLAAAADSWLDTKVPLLRKQSETEQPPSGADESKVPAKKRLPDLQHLRDLCLKVRLMNETEV